MAHNCMFLSLSGTSMLNGPGEAMPEGERGAVRDQERARVYNDQRTGRSVTV